MMYIPSTFEVYEANRAKFISYLKRRAEIPEELFQCVMDLVGETDYFEAPASASHHLNVPGGLFVHSLNVAKLLEKYTREGFIEWERPYSPYLIGLLHDFCKVGRYMPINNGYTYVDTPGFGGHGEDSLCKILLKVPLTREEAMCIRWHMGPYEKDKWKDYDLAVKKYPNVQWTHHADMVASKTLEG